MRLSGTILTFSLLVAPAAAGEMSLLHAGTPIGEEHWGEASILQAGGSSLAVQEQVGYSNGHITQIGIGNFGLQVQTGDRNRAYTFQSGSGNTAMANQDGTGNRASMVQLGNGNTAMTNQSGGHNSAAVVQTGAQYMLVYQRGALNQLTPGQIPKQPALILQQGLNVEPTVIPLRGK